MEKNVVSFLLASMALLVGWTLLQQRFFPPPAPPAGSPSSVGEAGKPSTEAAAPSRAGAPELALPGAAEVPAAAGAGARAAPSERPPEQLVTVERAGLYRAVFTSWGAAPAEFILLDPQYRVKVGDHDEQINMVPQRAGQPAYLTWYARDGADGERSEVELAAAAAWTLQRRSDSELVYSVEAGDLHLEKKWTFPAAGYALGLELTAVNRGARRLRTHLLVSVGGFHDPTVTNGGWASFGRRAVLHEAMCELGGKLKHEGLDSLLKAPFRQQGDLRWIGTGEQFFVTAAAFAGPADRVCRLSAEGSGRLEARAVFEEKTIAPGETVTVPMATFAGPKLLDQLDAVQVAGTSPKLSDAVNYTLEIVARPMLAVLKAIHRVVRNWGVAIIVITILLKLVMLYPTQQSMKSAKEMAKLKPQLDAIKTRWPDDKVKQSQEQQELFKKHKINPLGGCLPALLQMPIYFAFYSMLSNAVELYRSAFVWRIQDMTDQFWPMSLATGGIMFAQQLLSPQATDPQQKQMMYMMPVIFTAFTLLMPSGLTLYILTNTLLTMLHQWWLNRQDSPSSPRPTKVVRA